MHFLYSGMEELVTLQYGSFTLLGWWVKEFAQRTGCSKRVAYQTIWGQLYLNELKREYLDWNTGQCQEWGLFLLKCLLYNVASMRRKELERIPKRCSKAKWSETAEVMVPEHPSIRTLLGSTNDAIFKVAKQVY